MCSLCQLPVAKNHNIWQILTFLGAPVPTPFTDEGQIWCARADPRSTFTLFTGQISSECVHCVGFRWPKTMRVSNPRQMEFWNQIRSRCVKTHFCLRSRAYLHSMRENNTTDVSHNNIPAGMAQLAASLVLSRLSSEISVVSQMLMRRCY